MNIAVFLPNWIGDAVMATPALRALRQHFVGACLIGIHKPYIGGVLEGAPWLDAQLLLDNRGPWAQRWPSVAAQLRQWQPELAILFPNTVRSALTAWLGGCRRRIGFRRYCRGWLLTDRLEPQRDHLGRLKPAPIINDYNRLVMAAGCPDPGHRLELFTTAQDELAAEQVWADHRLNRYPEVIGLNPGAAFGAAKHWPSDHFVALARRLVDERGSGVLVLCGPAERALAQDIARRAERPAVVSLGDRKLSIGLTKACIRRVSLLITTDSGPRHFAAALGRPVVSLFGPTHIAWTDTFYPWEVCLQKKVSCGPCQQRVCPLDHRCMIGLTPAEVFAAAVDLLGRYSSQANPDPTARKAC